MRSKALGPAGWPRRSPVWTKAVALSAVAVEVRAEPGVLDADVEAVGAVAVPAGIHEVEPEERAPLVTPVVVGDPAEGELVEEELAVDLDAGRGDPRGAGPEERVVGAAHLGLGGPGRRSRG